MQTEDLQAAQAMFGLVSQVIYREPDDAQIAGFAQQDLFAEAPFGADDEAVTQGLTLMRSWCAEAVNDPSEFLNRMGDARRDHFQLLVGAGEPEAPCWAGYHLSPNKEIIGSETLPVRQLYRRFGLEMEHKNSEPDDNLGVMLGFLAHLIGLEADEGVCDEMRAEASRAERELLVERVLPWIAVWRYDMARHARTDYFRGVGELVFGLVRTFSARFGVRYDEGRRVFTA